MMRIAIFSAGPSLMAQCNGHTPSNYDLSIAVNSAAEKLACDWWCILDGNVASRFSPLGTPIIFTENRHLRRMRNDPQMARFELRSVQSFVESAEHNPPAKWRDYTIAAAMVIAGCAGMASEETCDRVEVFGVDMTDAPDCSGRKGKHQAQRWSREEAVCKTAIQWLAGHGIEVIHGASIGR